MTLAIQKDAISSANYNTSRISEIFYYYLLINTYKALNVRLAMQISLWLGLKKKIYFHF